MHESASMPCFIMFVWTRKEVFIQQIDYDKKFVQDCMSKLKAFYFDELLPALTAEVLK